MINHTPVSWDMDYPIGALRESLRFIEKALFGRPMENVGGISTKTAATHTAAGTG